MMTSRQSGFPTGGEGNSQTTHGYIVVECTIRYKFQWNFNQNMIIFIQENVFKNIICNMVAILSES